MFLIFSFFQCHFNNEEKSFHVDFEVSVAAKLGVLKATFHF